MIGEPLARSLMLIIGPRLVYKISLTRTAYPQLDSGPRILFPEKTSAAGQIEFMVTAQVNQQQIRDTENLTMNQPCSRRS
jgi:hypothetical protein